MVKVMRRLCSVCEEVVLRVFVVVGEQHRNAPGKPAQRAAVELYRANPYATAACSLLALVEIL